MMFHFCVLANTLRMFHSRVRAITSSKLAEADFLYLAEWPKKVV